MGEDRHPQELLWESIGKNHFREKRGQRTPHLQMCLSTAEVLSKRTEGSSPGEQPSLFRHQPSHYTSVPGGGGGGSVLGSGKTWSSLVRSSKL